MDMLNKVRIFIIEIHLFIDLTPHLKKINDFFIFSKLCCPRRRRLYASSLKPFRAPRVITCRLSTEQCGNDSPVLAELNV